MFVSVTAAVMAWLLFKLYLVLFHPIVTSLIIHQDFYKGLTAAYVLHLKVSPSLVVSLLALHWRVC